jgi:uncharacterized protein YbjT (DUF2867 family)
VIRALKAGGQFKVRALTRNPGQHRDLADEVIEADLNRPETLAAAFKGAHGVFLVTTSSLEGTDERKQGTAAVKAASDAGVKHVVWSTLPDVEAISGSRFHVPHFTNKAKVDRIVKDAGFANHTFAIAPFFYQNLAGAMAPQQKADGSMGWALPLDPSVRCIHMGDIRELGAIVAGAFAHPDQAGHGEYLPLVGDFMSFNEIVDVLNRQGHNFSYAGPGRRLRHSLPWSCGDRRDVQVLRSAYLLGFGVTRPNCVRKQNSRQTTNEVFDVGSTECAGSDSLNATIHSM